MLRWATKIVKAYKLDLLFFMSQYQACSREGHPETLFHIFTCMKKNPKVMLHFDPTLPKKDYTTFVSNWGIFSRDIT